MRRRGIGRKACREGMGGEGRGYEAARKILWRGREVTKHGAADA